MRIVMIRHAKVDMRWEKSYDSRSFDRACLEYDKKHIVFEGKENIQIGNREKIYISDLSRTYETACKLFEESNFVKTSLINEVPLKSFKDTSQKYPLWLWNFWGRVQWLLQNKRQPEGMADTAARAKKFIDTLEKDKEDCYVVTHGFFMRAFIKELKRKGYKIKQSKLFKISNLEKIIAEKG